MSDETLNSEAAGAVPEAGATTPPDAVDTGASGDAEAPTPKTFTQEEMDAAIQKRLAIAERKWQREQQAQVVEAAQRPSLTEAPRPENFDNPVTYAEALAEFKVAQKFAERDAQERQHKAKTVPAMEEYFDAALAYVGA